MTPLLGWLAESDSVGIVLPVNTLTGHMARACRHTYRMAAVFIKPPELK